jgi:protein-S-isoprenylcysteine O-methyltransferase Ste14
VWKLKNILLAAVLAVVLVIIYILLSIRGTATEDWMNNSNWPFVIISIIFFSTFILFLPYRGRLSKRPASVYLAFIVALYVEMYGIPFTAYILLWTFGVDKMFTFEHILSQLIGDTSFTLFMYVIYPIATAIIVIGLLLIIFGWKAIHENKGEMVTTGIYSHVRHPQYLGFLLLTFGMNLEWTTFFTLLLYPVIVVLYYRLARSEEKYSIEIYGDKYKEYMKKVPMLIPRIRKKPDDSE